MADLPKPPEPLDHSPFGPRPPGSWVVVGLAFGMACVLPSVFFLATAFSDDQTASRTAGGAAAWLIGIEVVIGAAAAAVGWAASRSRKPSTRSVMTMLILLGAAGSGLVTGFLGGVAIAMERHPTWDDA